MSDSGDLDRLVRRARQSRRWETATFPQAGGGTLHYPAPPTLTGKPTTGGGELTIGHPPIGARLRLSGSSHVGPGGEVVPFDTIVADVAWLDPPVTPAVEWIHPWDAIYGLELWGAYDDPFNDAAFPGGGTWQLLLDGLAVDAWPNTITAQTRGRRWWPDHIEYDAAAGQMGSLRLTHASASGESIDWVANITSKEPLREIVPSCEVVVAGKNPLGWWKFDETSGSTAFDSSGNGFDLSIAASNVTVGQPSFCCGDGSYDFAGVQGINSNWVGSGTNAFDFEGTPSFSAAIWVDLDAAGADQHLVGTQFFDANWGGWGLTVQTGNIWRFARSSGGTISVDNLNVSGSVGPTNSVGIPRLIVGTYDGADMRMYVDGILKGTLASTRNVADSALFSIGEARTSVVSQNPLNGQVCDCQVYDYALSPTDVEELYDAGTEG